MGDSIRVDACQRLGCLAAPAEALRQRDISRPLEAGGQQRAPTQRMPADVQPRGCVHGDLHVTLTCMKGGAGPPRKTVRKQHSSNMPRACHLTERSSVFRGVASSAGQHCGTAFNNWNARVITSTAAGAAAEHRGHASTLASTGAALGGCLACVTAPMKNTNALCFCARTLIEMETHT